MILGTISREFIDKNVYTVSQSYIAHLKHGTAYGYTPSNNEVKAYANKLGFREFTPIPYKTLTNPDRIIYILSDYNPKR